MPEFDWMPGPFASLTRTPDETSVVCLTANVPTGARSEGPFALVEVAGPLSFAAVGVFAEVLEPLVGRRHLGAGLLDLRHRLGARAGRRRPRRRGRLAPGRPGHHPHLADRRHLLMSVTTPRGFRAAGVTAGLKASGRPDVALVVNDGPDHHAAAVFTGNRVEAAPVTWSRTVVADGRADAVVLNSGGANACTGAPGFQDTHRTAEHVGAALGIAPGDVVVCSTGLIGERLPMDLLLPGIDAAAAALAADGGPAAAEAIMTTDTVAKTARRPARRLVGRRDGQGRRHARPRAGHDARRRHHGCRRRRPPTSTTCCAPRPPTTFDRVDSDGCMSTNDTVVLLASGASGVEVGRRPTSRMP